MYLLERTLVDIRAPLVSNMQCRVYCYPMHLNKVRFQLQMKMSMANVWALANAIRTLIGLLLTWMARDEWLYRAG